ncbi:MAG: hypothetical protein KIT27_08455 [Legionellales bacterium]|nr:hypothetical protein [Legionellales bacterium]
MAEYANKLLELAQRKQRLIEEETRLIQKRKTEIANLAERFTVLTATDEIFAALFNELAQALNEKSAKLKEWETHGARFLKSRKNTTTTKASHGSAKKTHSSVSTDAHAGT